MGVNVVEILRLVKYVSIILVDRKALINGTSKTQHDEWNHQTPGHHT